MIPWTVVYGAPLGTVSWSVRVDSQAAMGAAQNKLMSDAGYITMVTGEAARLFSGPAEDAITQFIASAGTGANTGGFAQVITAQCAPGKISAAMAWGVEIMNHVHKVTGLNAAMVRGLYGPFATIGWIILADSLDQVDAAEAATSSDPSYIESIDGAGDLFSPGTASSRLLRRLG